MFSERFICYRRCRRQKKSGQRRSNGEFRYETIIGQPFVVQTAEKSVGWLVAADDGRSSNNADDYAKNDESLRLIIFHC